MLFDVVAVSWSPVFTACSRHEVTTQLRLFKIIKSEFRIKIILQCHKIYSYWILDVLHKDFLKIMSVINMCTFQVDILCD